MREFNHWSEQGQEEAIRRMQYTMKLMGDAYGLGLTNEEIKQRKRKDRMDKVIFALLIIGVGVVTWII